MAEHAADRASELIVFTRAFFNNQDFTSITTNEKFDMGSDRLIAQWQLCE